MIKKFEKDQTHLKKVKNLERQLDLNLSHAFRIDLSNGLVSELEARKIAVKQLRSFYIQNRDLLKTILELEPLYAPHAISYYSKLTDKIIISTVSFVLEIIHNIANPTKSEKICVLAVGGFGRQQMAPFSDIDLLFVTPYKQTAWGESVIESVLYILWDLKLKIGYSVRTIDDCIRLGRQDFTVRTSLLEHRYLIGERALQILLTRRLWSELFQKTGHEFIEAKLDERTLRHNRHGGVRYMLEPNVKEGKGGLRDLQTLYWITKYLYKTSSTDELIKAKVFNPSEVRIFKNAENFLWSVRCSLHLITERQGEQLNFSNQVELANKFGYNDRKGMRGVERFMQAYFVHAKNVGDLTRIFLTALEAKHVRIRPGIGAPLRNFVNFGISRFRPTFPKSFGLTNGRLNIADTDNFLSDPINLMKLFQVSLEAQLLIHPNALQLVARNLELIDESFLKDVEANKIFLDLLLNYNNPEKALRHMNEVGLLGKFVPEFGRIVAMMQFNMYHSFTVDEHTIQAIRTLAEIENRNLVEDLPIASNILSGDINRRILYISLLLHDLGKGLPEDHSIIGSQIAGKLAPRFGLKREESEIVVWLVRNHLLMSDIAQKRDIADSRTVRDFANQVKSTAKLKLLTVLTVCDIRGVGPNAWNNWKAVLLRELYSQTLSFLTEGSMSISKPEQIKTAKNLIVHQLDKNFALNLDKVLERHYDNFWLGLDSDTQLSLIRLLHGIPEEPIQIEIVADPRRDATMICCALEDHPGIFARLTGAIAVIGANVVDARTYTTRDGFATSVFWVQTKNNKQFESRLLEKIANSIKSALLGQVIPKNLLDEKGKFSRAEREFKVPTTITFDNDGSDIYTIIEIDTRDRIGLIHDLANTLYKNNISIFTAIIATYGEQAVDTFYVKDLFGLKLYAKTKQEKIARQLRESIEEGAVKAMK